MSKRDEAVRMALVESCRSEVWREEDVARHLTEKCGCSGDVWHLNVRISWVGLRFSRFCAAAGFSILIDQSERTVHQKTPKWKHSETSRKTPFTRSG
jgi:hypothetical protein